MFEPFSGEQQSVCSRLESYILGKVIGRNLVDVSLSNISIGYYQNNQAPWAARGNMPKNAYKLPYISPVYT